MKNVLECFLDALEIGYTRQFATALYQEHPHKYNMYGLKKMLDVYGVKTLGVYIGNKELSVLNYPCVLHVSGDFVVGLDYGNETITYLQHGRKTTVGHDVFKRMWTGHTLVVEETTEASEPNYREHRRKAWVSMGKTYCIPVLLLVAAGIGMADNWGAIGIPDLIRMALSAAGIMVCALLMEKQLFGESRYGDRVCSLFHHADCNSILDGPMAKVFGISWSEIGLGYFIVNLLLLSLYPASSGMVAVINWVAMLYGVWSICYQWRVARSWCVLCVIVQVIIWMMGVVAIISGFLSSFAFDIAGGLLSCIVFAVGMMAVHQYASAHATEQKRVRTVQQYHALKANGMVAKVLIEEGEYHEITSDDSSIIFGNPEAKMCVTILSNPHCNPCARMHRQVEELLDRSGDDLCVQYVFSSFNDSLEDSSRYLISCYMNHDKEQALRKFSLWYARDKFDYKRVVKENEAQLHPEAVEKEMEKHRKWRKKTSLTATPTVLVNGYKLPREYELVDLAMISDTVINKKNIVYNINGRSTTPLGVDSLSAVETV